MQELFKNLYNEAYIELLSTKVKSEYNSFNSKKFTETVFDKDFKDRELKSRMRHISTTLGAYLPKNYKHAIDILKLAFKKMNFAYGLENMIFQDFVALYGLVELETSLDALECFTINSSSEFAIREFILHHPKQTMKRILLWAKSENEHIRRLASEGSRPRLPWAIALPIFKNNPTEVIEILELLKDDESVYVRKSVSNNLNDISKDNPELVKKIASEWINYSNNRDSLLKHGCRTLLKNSDTQTLELFGYSYPKNIKVEKFTYDTEVTMGENLAFSFELNAAESLGKLRLEFALEFLRKNNKHNKKVFKISEGIYTQSQKKINKSYSFRPITTRVYYRGLHKLSLLVNGVVFKEVEFTLS